MHPHHSKRKTWRRVCVCGLMVSDEPRLSPQQFESNISSESLSEGQRDPEQRERVQNPCLSEWTCVHCVKAYFGGHVMGHLLGLIIVAAIQRDGTFVAVVRTFYDVGAN